MPGATKVQHVESFCSNLRSLLAMGQQYLGNNEEFRRIKKQVQIGIETVPTSVLEKVTEALKMHHEAIVHGDINYFLEYDYQKDIQQFLDGDDSQSAAALISLLKQLHPKIEKSEVEEAMGILLDLYSDCLEYEHNE